MDLDHCERQRPADQESEVRQVLSGQACLPICHVAFSAFWECCVDWSYSTTLSRAMVFVMPVMLALFFAGVVLFAALFYVVYWWSKGGGATAWLEPPSHNEVQIDLHQTRGT